MMRAVRRVTTDTYMLWSPNSRFRDVDATIGGYSQYWPGAAWVDLVGMSLYWYGGYERLDIEPTANFVSDTLTEFDGLYGSAQKKHIVLSETGASYVSNLKTGNLRPTLIASNPPIQAINLDTGKPNNPPTGAASEYVIKVKYWRQLFDKVSVLEVTDYIKKLNLTLSLNRACMQPCLTSRPSLGLRLSRTKALRGTRPCDKWISVALWVRSEFRKRSFPCLLVGGLPTTLLYECRC